MKAKRSYSTSVAFLDLLFNTLLCFAALFVTAFILVNPVSDENKIDVHADFLITVFWPEDIPDDVDLYVKDPQGTVVYFGKKESDLMHLDRDDQGGNHDYVETPFGKIEYKENREIVTIRKVIPGEYIINLHMYSKRNPSPNPITIQVDKINPFSTVLLKTVTLIRDGEEKTVCRLILDSNNEVKSISYVQQKIVKDVQSTPWGVSRWD